MITGSDRALTKGFYVKEYAAYAMVFDCVVDMESLEVIGVFSEMNLDEEIKREYVIIGKEKYPVAFAYRFEETDYDDGTAARYKTADDYGVPFRYVLLRQ